MCVSGGCKMYHDSARSDFCLVTDGLAKPRIRSGFRVHVILAIKELNHFYPYPSRDSASPDSFPSQQNLLQLENNNLHADHNRKQCAATNLLVMNLVSSPGSGKTTLLTETLMRNNGTVPCAVIEGDQQTFLDVARIRQIGTPAIQINTEKGCHLDAKLVGDALQHLPLKRGSILFIENVCNLVCPANFDLGERHKVVVLSVAECEEKPLKYPHMFAATSVMLLNKIELLPFLQFDVEKCLAQVHEVNPDIRIIPLSAESGEGMDEWLSQLEAELCAQASQVSFQNLHRACGGSEKSLSASLVKSGSETDEK